MTENQGANRQSSSETQNVRPRTNKRVPRDCSPLREPKWFEVNICFALPDALYAGIHTLTLNLGREFAPARFDPARRRMEFMALVLGDAGARGQHPTARS